MPTIFRKSDGQFTVRAWSETSRHGTETLRVRYWFAGCAPVNVPAGATPEAAAERARAAWEFYTRGEFEAPQKSPASFGEAAERWVERESLSDATAKSYAACVALYIEQAGDRACDEITKGSVLKWLDGYKPVTHNTYLRTLRGLIRWCVEQGWMKADVTAGIPYAKHEHEIRPWLRHDQWGKLLAVLGPADAIRAAFALHVGMRASEIANARWSWVQGIRKDAMSIRVPASKSAKARAVPLNNVALELLEQARVKWPESDYIFGNHRTSQTNNWPRRVRAACEKAGITSIDFHGLRRSAGAHWLASGIPMHIVSLWLGHRSIETTMKHYAGIADRDSMRWVLNEDEVPNVVPMRRRE